MKKAILTTAAAFLAVATPAMAQDSAGPAYFTFGTGYYDVFDNDGDALSLRAEYHHDKSLFWKIKPWAGAEITTDASVWAGGGLLADIELSDKIYLQPSIGVGLYTQGSNDKDLGGPIQFRTQLEGGYEFNSGHRLGVTFSHYSNAGLDDDNPGTEVLGLNYSIPINGLRF